MFSGSSEFDDLYTVVLTLCLYVWYGQVSVMVNLITLILNRWRHHIINDYVDVH